MAKAAVYYFDQETTSWQQADKGISMVYIYQDAANNSYRVVGISQPDAKVSNSSTNLKGGVFVLKKKKK